jgi:PAS domain S-box-containing protein
MIEPSVQKSGENTAHRKGAKSAKEKIKKLCVLCVLAVQHFFQKNEAFTSKKKEREKLMNEPVRILVVEDSTADFELAKGEICQSVKECAFQRVETRKDFLKALESFQPNIVLSDYYLSRFNGMTALKLTHKRAPMTPFIIWTVTLSEEIAVKCMKAGATDYILKGNLKRLGPAVVQALEDKKAWRERKQEEGFLSQSEHLLRVIADNIPAFVSYLDQDRCYQFVNQHYAENFRKSITDMIGKPYREIVGEAYYQATLNNVNAAFSGKRVSYETTIDLPEIGRRWLMVSYTPDVDKLDNVRGIFIAAYDISERKQAEEALRESEARFSAVFHTSPIGISISRLTDGQYIDVNEAFLGLFGYTREEALSHTSLQLQTWAFPEDRGRAVKMLREQGRIRGMEAQCRKKSGEIWTGLASAEVMDVASESYILVLLQDITERKRAEEEQRSLVKHWQTTFAAVNDGICLLDEDQRIIRCNHAMPMLLNLPMEKLIGRHCWEIVHGTKEPMENCPVLRAKKSLHRESLELQVGNRWFDIVVDPILDESGTKMVSAVHIAREITERKRAEEVIRQRVEDLEHFHKLAVGRETRQIELKKEINELCSLLGIEQRYPLSFLEHKGDRNSKEKES